MFHAYNAALHKFPKDLFEVLEGNTYETTIFCISSAITKLAKLTPVPDDQRLYRGQGGIVLPEEFWKKGPDGFRGVEKGLLSTTASMEVAVIITC